MLGTTVSISSEPNSEKDFAKKGKFIPFGLTLAPFP